MAALPERGVDLIFKIRVAMAATTIYTKVNLRLKFN
jgi:hypothetical protein